jgi:hypothetical protein
LAIAPITTTAMIRRMETIFFIASPQQRTEY